jgi:peptidoglycan/LPS O-acetylase OafA/YrhL
MQRDKPAAFEKPISEVVRRSGVLAAGEGYDRPARDPRLVGHVPALDGVRGIAISMVLVLHFVANVQPTTRLERALFGVLNFGDLGVDLFFILSGFLITGILIDAKGSRGFFRNFYMRRTLRIFPLYYGVLTAIFVVAPHISFFSGADLEKLSAEQGWAWLYAVNILTGIRGYFGFPYIDHFWSLAVEEHFYFFWPLVVWACSRRTLVGVSAAVVLLSVVSRMGAAALHVNTLALHVLTPFRLDALCLGALLAARGRGPGGLDALRRAVIPALLVASAVFAASYVVGRANVALFEPTHQLRATIFGVFFGALIVGSLTAEPRGIASRAVSSPLLRFFGKYSYGLYVFHHFFSFYMMTHDTEAIVTRWVGSHLLAVVLQALVGIGASLAVAIVSYDVFESRFLALKRFWAPPVAPEASLREQPPLRRSA